MGKGFNNYMTKKFFHPASKDNIKRKWMAEQKTAFEKKAQEDLLAQYQKEQEVLSNRALLGDEKAKLGLSFLYDAPPGLKKKEESEGQQQEVKFEWQRKYNAPREAYAKDDDTIRDQPFGIEVRNVRCIKCRQWGHVNTDKICPLFSRNLTAEPEMPESSSSGILDGLRADGFTIKNSVLGRMMGEEPDKHHKLLQDEDEEDPEVKFLKSLTPKQKKKLLKKLNKLQTGSSKEKKKKSKKRKSDSDNSDTDSSDKERLHKVKKSKGKSHKSHKHKRREVSDSESESDQEVKERMRKHKHEHKEDRKGKDSHRDRYGSQEERSHSSGSHKAVERRRDRSRSRDRSERRDRSSERDRHSRRYDRD